MYHLGSKVSLGNLGTCSRRATMVGMNNGEIVHFGRAEMKALLESFFVCQRTVDVLACREHGPAPIMQLPPVTVRSSGPERQRRWSRVQ